MGRDELKAALQTAGLQADELAEIVEVDVKTAQRWLSSTRIPHPRHRTRIARALDTPEQHIWPELDPTEPDPPAAPPTAGTPPLGNTGTAGAGDRVTAYTDVTHPDAPLPAPALLNARDQIDMLRSIPGIEAWRQLLQVVELTTEHPCPTRILIQHPAQTLHPPDPDPDPDERDQLIRQLAATPHVTLGQTVKQNYETIVRADDQMFVTIDLGHTPYQRCPYLHIQRTTQDGIFDRFANYLDQEWEDAQPVLLSTRQPPPPPRRWPGRPS